MLRGEGSNCAPKLDAIGAHPLRHIYVVVYCHPSSRTVSKGAQEGARAGAEVGNRQSWRKGRGHLPELPPVLLVVSALHQLTVKIRVARYKRAEVAQPARVALHQGRRLARCMPTLDRRRETHAEVVLQSSPDHVVLDDLDHVGAPVVTKGATVDVPRRVDAPRDSTDHNTARKSGNGHVIERPVRNV